MKKLYLLRHAKSDQDGTPDFDRTLNLRGLREAERMGIFLREKKLSVDHILCSSSMRTRQTCERVCLEWGYRGPIDYRQDLYLATSEELLRIAHSSLAGAVMLIAHNPGLEELSSALAKKWVVMPPCSLSAFQSEPWSLEWHQDVGHLNNG